MEIDVRALLELVYPKNDFEIIRYFTAHVKPLPHNLEQPIRQQVYLRALRTLPGLVKPIHPVTAFSINKNIFTKTTSHLPPQPQFIKKL